MKQNIIIGIVFSCLLTSCGGTSKRPEVNTHLIKDATVMVYDSGEHKFTESEKKVKYHFFNNSTIPYFEVKEYAETFVENYNLKYSFENKGNQYLVKLNNQEIDSSVTFNVDNQTINFVCMTAMMTGTATGNNPFAIFLEEGRYLFKDQKYEMLEKPGSPKYTIDLSSYNMKMYELEGKFYLPDFVMNSCFTMGGPLPIYNGVNAYYYNEGTDAQESFIAYGLIRKEATIFQTNEYLQYNYDYLAYIFDHFFGLDKRTSRVTNKEHIYFENGAYKALEPFKEKLLSKDPNVSNNAMYEFFNKEVDDGGHSQYDSSNLFSTSSEHPTITGDLANTSEWTEGLSKARDNAQLSPKQISSKFDGYYTEKDGVAFVTFDSFTNRPDRKLTKDDLAEEVYGEYTASLIGYANNKIHKNNIKNVVLDLTCNGGGAGDVAMFIVSWLSREGATFTLRNSKDKSMYRAKGYADVDFDGTYDVNKDTIPSDVNIYAIISNATFSSGNYLPVMLKEHTKCKFIGTETGGGSCNAGGVYTPLLSSIRLSGLFQLGLNNCTKDNYVSDEMGVKADFYTFPNDKTSYTKFFDRQDIINKIKGE